MFSYPKILKDYLTRSQNKIFKSIDELIEDFEHMSVNKFDYELKKILSLADSELPPTVTDKINLARRRVQGRGILKLLKDEIISLARFDELVDEIGGREAAGIEQKDVSEAQNTARKHILNEYGSGKTEERICYCRLEQIFGQKNSLDIHKWLSNHAPRDKDMPHQTNEHQPHVERPPARSKPVWPINQCAGTGRFPGARYPSVNSISNAHP